MTIRKPGRIERAVARRINALAWSLQTIATRIHAYNQRKQQEKAVKAYILAERMEAEARK